MLDRVELVRHTLVPGDFYDTIDRYRFNAAELADIVLAKLPKDWGVRRKDVWLNVAPLGERGPAEGWKLHVSSTLADAARLLDIVATELISQRVSFKFALDMQMLRLLNGRNWPKGAAAKFITVYPSDTPTFLSLGARLEELTRDFDGPYILSDRRFRSSRVVHYRYGTMSSQSVTDAYGRRTSVLRGPGGDVPDRRVGHFVLPPWLEDPVAGPTPVHETRGGAVVLNNGRFVVDKMIGTRSAGGIYVAFDNELVRQVIIKEARPLIGGDEGMDAIASLKKEFRLLTLAQESGFTPRPVSLFADWDHLFLVQDYLKTVATLGNFAARNTPPLPPTRQGSFGAARSKLCRYLPATN